MEYRPIARSSDLVVQEVGEETLVYDLKTNKAKCLNETSAMIWKLCDGTRSAVEITMALSAELKTKVEQELILVALDQLQKEELLKSENDVVFALEGTSRRELIKKVGFAAVVALPVVSSVVAPAAAQTGSIPTVCNGLDPRECECGSGPNNGVQNCLILVPMSTPDDWVCVSTNSTHANPPGCGTGMNPPCGCATGLSKCCFPNV